MKFEEQRLVTLLDGTPGIVRPIRPSDRGALAGGFDALSPESRVRRFFYNKQSLSEMELDQLTHPDGVDHIAFGLAVKSPDTGEEMPVAVGRFFRDEAERDLAEIAFVTADEWQGVGVGYALMQSLTDAALSVGIRRWFASLLSDNTVSQRLLSRFGEKCEERGTGGGVVEVIYKIVTPEDSEDGGLS